MRTTVDIPDDLYRAIKILAAERGTTVRELILEGLETVLKARKAGRAGVPETPILSESGAPDPERETNDELIGFP
jgi:hypothetical protein